MTSAKNLAMGAAPPRQIYQILAGQMFDSVTRTFVPNQVITVDSDSGTILDVCPQAMARKPEEALAAYLGPGQKPLVEITRINHSNLIVIPGLVDVHVHLFLHPYSETSWEDQLTKESLAERTVRATVHARRTLMAGFTTVRDLGTEGAFDADIGLRKCLSGKTPLIPGPRYYCSTRAIISTGSYGPKSSLYPAQEGIDGVKGAVAVDGVHECVKEVRKQIGAGADWVKIYADYRCRSRQSDVSLALANESMATFNREELTAIIEAAHSRGVKVAAHVQTSGAIDILLDLGINSIEHGAGLYDASIRDKALVRKLLRSDTIWVPTLSAFYTSSVDAGSSGYAKKMWDQCQATFQEVLGSGLDHVACGGDTGVFAHGNNALELILMRRLGAGWERVLGWATYGGWKCLRGMEWEGERGDRRLAELEKQNYARVDPAERPDIDRGVPFGVIRRGWAADLVAVEGKLDGSVQDFEDTLTKGVKFVMKAGKIYKRDGAEVLDS